MTDFSSSFRDLLRNIGIPPPSQREVVGQTGMVKEDDLPTHHLRTRTIVFKFRETTKFWFGEQGSLLGLYASWQLMVTFAIGVNPLSPGVRTASLSNRAKRSWT